MTQEYEAKKISDDLKKKKNPKKPTHKNKTKKHTQKVRRDAF